MKKIHFIGIAGIGMSGLAHVSLSRGVSVSGSDLRPNNLTDELVQRGAVIYKGHLADNVPGDADLIVKSTCIKEDNPEVKKAIQLGIPVIPRSDMLKLIMQDFPLSVAITGTHGKTTTSALIAHIAESSKIDPTVIVGGEIDILKSNAKAGQSGIIIAEVDESDGYFQKIMSKYAVLTNVEREHMEHYGNFENLVKAYEEFARGVDLKGCLIFNGQDSLLKSISSLAKCKKISFGIDGNFNITCQDYNYKKSIEFDLIVDNKDVGRIESPLIGRYNLMNVLGAIALSFELGLNFHKIAQAVKSFKGAKRRFDVFGEVGKIKVVEDYAHHPTELKSVIEAAKEYSQGRVITIFQPHRYSRTKDLLEDFAKCFYSSDVLILTDIYSADETINKDISSRDIYDKIDDKKFEIKALVKKESIPEKVSEIAKKGDIILVLGAGDIREILPSLIDLLKKRNEQKM